MNIPDTGGEITTILLPSGRDYAACVGALASELGLEPPAFADRQLSAEQDGRTYVKVKGKDIPELLAQGYGDVGLTGTDVCIERIPTDPYASNVRYRAVGEAMCTLNLLWPQENDEAIVARLQDASTPSVVVATSYPKLLMSAVRQARAAGEVMNLRLQGFRPGGAVEAMPRLGVAQAIADIVSSGQTAQANGLMIGPALANILPALVWRDPTMPQRSLAPRDTSRPSIH